MASPIVSLSIEVRSSTDPETVYVVTRRGSWISCTCRGYQYRGTCRHLVFAPSLRDLDRAEALAGYVAPAPPAVRVPLFSRLSAI